jgi:dolichol-phosphate mannosyltransferase
VIDLAFKGIFAHSYVPLRLITLIGVVLSALSVVTTVVMALVWFTIGVPFAGFGTLFSLVVLLFGLLFLMMGIVSEYLGLVYEEVKQRPNFIVRGDIGFNGPADGGQTGDLPR